jgi:retron-type reverse transcriptase
MIAERIALELGLDLEYVTKVAATASHRYKSYTIPKRTGGTRTIHHPSRELKLFQGWLIDNILDRLPVHEAASAYRNGASIRKHAALHVGQNYLLKVDFENFFPSITQSDVAHLLGKGVLDKVGLELTIRDMEFVRRIVCRNGFLTIGAPSSPILSNAVMYDFDNYWYRETEGVNVRYSRYADDLYFSTNQRGVLSDLLQRLRIDIRRRSSPKLSINDAKTAFTSRKRKRLVTGLVLTADKRISLGRQCKRRIRSLVYKNITGGLSDEQRKHLRGFIAYAGSVEPTFVESIRRKYGSIVIDSL